MQTTTIKCQICKTNQPEHIIEHLHNSGKRITVCQYCITGDDFNLARRFSKLSGVDYNRLVGSDFNTYH